MKRMSFTPSWRRTQPYKNQSINLQNKSVNWFLYDKDLRHKGVNIDCYDCQSQRRGGTSKSNNDVLVILCLTLSWRRSLSYRNQSIDLLCKSMDWFLYDRDLCHEKVNVGDINLFLCNVPILCCLKIKNILWFSGVFRG